MKKTFNYSNSIKLFGKISLIFISTQLLMGCEKSSLSESSTEAISDQIRSTNAAAGATIGDPGFVYDASKEDPFWAAKMKIWATAGAPSGIPILANLVKGATVTAKTSTAINAAISSCPAGKYVYLPNGTYDITEQVKLKSNVYLVGESRDSAVCKINAAFKTGVAFALWNITKSGIYNLTILGGWGTPPQNWNPGNGGVSPRPDVTSWSVGLKNGTTNCFLDNVKIKDSGTHPLVCNADHNTFRKLYIDGVQNKGGGGEGYFFFMGGYNLITDCFVTHLRHFSLQGSGSEYNVVYKNSIEQEISFHSGDNGNNLIEQNNITLPSDMTDIYYGIMGPWSIQHTLSNNPNFIYKNNVLEQNHSNHTPWSLSTKIYNGPYVVKPLTEAGIYNNFREMVGKTPIHGTLYAVK
ncbi:hypothetical protein I5M32_15780 [Pedobacter sp. SD-b]|uniref:Rhamnogalacturonase A/B/Epimerase-like pectate lyase domain-containing protein n=1 Tax=Pedobacter segetis TaxID=2793069 RepID=A0ABS1BNF7_9SPHI|nr:glycosyl hydrolase family 28-related protein [Pedobacter segetis]MBK0384425.1 hypothetical protein [Pedobacter segetis]